MVLGVFIEAAGNYGAVPGNYGIVPQAPAMVLVIALELHAPFLVLFVAAVLVDGGDQLIWIILVVIHLCGFQAHLVYTYFLRQPVQEEWGRVAVFEDLYGNLWDLIEPVAAG